MKARIRPKTDDLRLTMIRNHMRILYIACIAANRVFKAGNVRLQRFIMEMLQLSEEYKVLSIDGVGDTKLLRAVQQIIPDIERLFPEK